MKIVKMTFRIFEVFQTIADKVAQCSQTFSLEKIPKDSNEFWDHYNKEEFDDLRNFKGQLILK
ncbi:hypothetical protein RUL31_09960 [Bacillus atrophaeus]|uniref:hypothetical protein n=1 Tax=Bacillus atrophaeus TaxID=1452 RepID=UPI0028F726F8|nr:hypothetical protein [Bacillus atrophaeus]WNV81550.1 hypothetical protein RUL31_09960 [Bacillus atrophaeus]